VTLVILFVVIAQFSMRVAGYPAMASGEARVEQIKVVEHGFEVKVINGGSEPLTIAQTIVDGAFWNADYEPGGTLDRFGQANVGIMYPWVEGASAAAA
jgi:ZIP family zinc transporter